MEIFGKFQETVMSVNVLTGDDDFESLIEFEDEEVVKSPRITIT